MRDPYLYNDIDVLKNSFEIKDQNLLRKLEADTSNLAMTSLYNQKFDKYDVETLQEIHRMIFGQLYDWAGEFRTIQMVKAEEVLCAIRLYGHPKAFIPSMNIWRGYFSMRFCMNPL